MIGKKEIVSFVRKLGLLDEVNAVYVFGSYETSRFNEMSDIDLCLFGNFSREEKMKILSLNEERFDVSFFDELPIWIKKRVFDGKSLFCKDNDFMKRIKLSFLNEYLDFYPVVEYIVNRGLDA